MNYFTLLFVQIILRVWLIVYLFGVKTLILAPLFGFLDLSDLWLFIFFTLSIFNASVVCRENFIFAAIVSNDDVLFAFLSMSTWFIFLVIGPQSSFEYLFTIYFIASKNVFQINNSIGIKIIIQKMVFNSALKTYISFFVVNTSLCFGFISLYDHIYFIVNICQTFQGFTKNDLVFKHISVFSTDNISRYQIIFTDISTDNIF